jgi:hypothetical protein
MQYVCKPVIVFILLTVFSVGYASQKPTVGSVTDGQKPNASRDTSASELKRLSLCQLFARLDSARKNDFLERPENKRQYDAILIEIVQRGGAEAEKLLEEKLKKNEQAMGIEQQRLEKIDYLKEPDRWRNQKALVKNLQNNLELLTALRRIQRKPDPLEVTISCRCPQLEHPPLEASATNVRPNLLSWHSAA